MLLDQDVKKILARTRTIAVVGAKDKPGPVDSVGRYLIDAGYEVIPVHPVRKSVWGIPARASLAEIDVPIDVVDLFRAPQFCAEHAREALAMQPLPALFWMQQGIANQEATELLAGRMAVVQDLCLMVEHRRFFPQGRGCGL